MKPNEQEDLDKMKAEMANTRELGFYAIRDALRMSETELKHSGYKTNEQAVVGIAKYYLDKLDKLVAAHIKKYPDR